MINYHVDRLEPVQGLQKLHIDLANEEGRLALASNEFTAIAR